ncbi:MAG: hypothetical protein U5K31_13110 [Balneolaceae bacterium]|nr:hypothetical protein [Balneolaceae bacterium]
MSLKREQSRSTSERELINNVIAEVLSRTHTTLSLPVYYTTSSLAAYTDSSDRILLKTSELSGSEFGRYSYYSVGKTRKGDITVLFFLLRKNSTPDIEVDLMVATVGRDGGVRSARSVAPFQRAVTGKRINSEVEVSKDLRIVSRIHDTGNDVVASASVEYRDFHVRADGRIIEPPFED